MHYRFTPHTLILLAAFLGGCASYQPLPTAERDLRLTEPGWVRLTLGDGSEQHGWLSNVTPEAFHLRQADGERSIARERVVRAEYAGGAGLDGRPDFSFWNVLTWPVWVRVVVGVGGAVAAIVLLALTY
jgi:hypothetical protein